MNIPTARYFIAFSIGVLLTLIKRFNPLLMRKIITFLAILSALTGSAQTQIQLPAGYGLNGPNGFLPNTAMPLYSYDGYLYCKAHLSSSISGFPGAFFKVNESTNAVTEITGVPIAFDLMNTHSFKVNNGELFCSLGNSLQVLRINPATNTYSTIAGVGFEFVILNDKIFGRNRAYHLATETFSNLMDPENPTQVLPPLEGFAVCDNSVYCVRNITDLTTGTPQYSSKVYRIIDGLAVSLLYTNTYNGIYSGFDDGKPIVFDNKILRRFTEYINNVGGTVYVESLDVDADMLNRIFTYEPINLQNSHYLFNNNIYLNNSLDQTWVSNGSDDAQLSDIPNIIKDASFSYNPSSPVYGGGGTAYIQNSTNVFGCRRILANGIVTYTVNKSDGTADGTSVIYTSTNEQLHSAIIVNNDLFFFKYTANGGVGALIRYNHETGQITNPVSFSLQSLLFGVNNSIFFYGVVNQAYGLYKLDAAALSTDFPASSGHLSVFPNPARYTLTVSHSEPIVDVNIFDMAGRSTGHARFDHDTIDVSHLAKGMYVLEIRTQTGCFRQKVVKE